MAVSVRMDPLLEQDLAAAAKRQGVTKSQFIVDAVERALGRKDPYALLLKVEQEMAIYDDDGVPKRAPAKSRPASSGTSHDDRLREALRAKHEADLRDWQAYHGVEAPVAKRRKARA